MIIILNLGENGYDYHSRYLPMKKPRLVGRGWWGSVVHPCFFELLGQGFMGCRQGFEVGGLGGGLGAGGLGAGGHGWYLVWLCGGLPPHIQYSAWGGAWGRLSQSVILQSVTVWAGRSGCRIVTVSMCTVVHLYCSANLL